MAIGGIQFPQSSWPTLSVVSVQQRSLTSEMCIVACSARAKKEAIEFQDWVFDVVLPTIRKTGKFDPENASSEYHNCNPFGYSLEQDTIIRAYKQWMYMLQQDNTLGATDAMLYEFIRIGLRWRISNADEIVKHVSEFKGVPETDLRFSLINLAKAGLIILTNDTPNRVVKP